MLAVVTQRMQLPHVLNEAVRRIGATGGRPLTIMKYTTMAAAVGAAPGAAFLVVDMTAIGPDVDLDEYATWWKVQNASGQIIVVNAPHDTVALGRQLYAIATHSQERLLEYKESANVDLWIELLLAHPFSVVMDALRHELLAALCTVYGSAADIANYAAIMQLFQLSPQTWRVGDFLHTDGETTEKAQRNKLGGMFRRAAQACPRDLITAFRLMIYLRLLEANRANPEQWCPREIAVQLQQGNAIGLRAFFKERTGLTVADMVLMRSDECQRLVLEMLSPGGDTVVLRTRLTELVGTIKTDPDRYRPARLFRGCESA